MNTIFKAFAPATVANCGPGFDIFGFAVEGIGDEVAISTKDAPGINLKIHGTDRLPLDPFKNSATRPLLDMMKEVGYSGGLNVDLYKNLPLGSGLGSSAASAVAAVTACNELFNLPFEKKELLRFCLLGEAAACGNAHADNVAPSLLGGFVVIRSYLPLEVISIPTPKHLQCCIIHPHIEVNTESARAILPDNYSRDEIIGQLGNIAGIISALYIGDLELFGRSLDDIIAVPYRNKSIPYFKEAKEIALLEGAFGLTISGSGPSMVAFCDSAKSAFFIGERIKDMYQRNGIGADFTATTVDQVGAKLL
jgi:homoserine kinase